MADSGALATSGSAAHRKTDDARGYNTRAGGSLFTFGMFDSRRENQTDFFMFLRSPMPSWLQIRT